MADSNDQSQHHQQASGFWTLTRPSKLSKRRNSDLHELHHKVFNISIVGLSGPDKDKGPVGIGKSCLCNRFFRGGADDYHTDHISVLSQSDFNGRIVNNDHWLYWGSVIKSCEGCDLAFNVIEQTEFVDDSCFQPFKTGKIDPYFKRCANTKPVSAEKLMYICKNQLGVEREYEQRYLPDGKFNVDGFLCLFDVSEVQGRNIDRQIEITNLIMLNLMKTRKPVVFVTTKHDEASPILISEAERLINQRDFRGLVPIVETSAQENVNVNIPFLVCAQLIDKTRAKIRIPSYFEAFNNHLELLNAASEAYMNLIRSTVIDNRTTWQQVCIKLSHNPEFLRFTYLHGLDKATSVFKSYLKKMRDDYVHQKVDIYIRTFPTILDELAPINATNHNIINNNFHEAKFSSSSTSELDAQNWDSIKEQLSSHPLFEKYFIRIPDGCHWYETELLQSPDNRIPSDWLNSEDAYNIFQRRKSFLESEHKKREAKDLFRHMLSSVKIPVGQPFIELKHLFSGTPELELLCDSELFDIYVEYQNNLLQQARTDFQSLLLENAEHLHQLASSNRVINQEDIQTINAILQYDDRYTALDRFSQDRTLMIIRHLSFLHSQLSETNQPNPSHPKSIENKEQQQKAQLEQQQQEQQHQPGKLDLSQFENITTAIGKLKVQPRALPEVPTSKPSSKTQSKASPINAQEVKTPQQPDIEPSTMPDSGFFKSRSKKPKAQAKDLRQNHGRAVAPPQLPIGMNSAIDSKFNSDCMRQSPAHGSYSQLLDEEAGLDFNQSPITQRLLKHSKDHKVSELNSPYESDNEPSHSRNLLKSKIDRGTSSGSEPGAIQRSSTGSTFNDSKIDSAELISNRDAAIRELNKILANKPPRQPGSQNVLSRGSSQEDEQPVIKSVSTKTGESKLDKESKKDKKKSKDDEKLEKKRLKEEERLKREERRQEKKASKKTKSTLTSSSVGADGVPYFIKRCIEFIEEEGLDAEGIYRVPGNRAHVDVFVLKFNENPDMSIDECDIPVNAVATALKDFLSKKWGPIIPLNLMNELTELSNISDKDERVEAVKNLVNKLPAANYKLLKYVFSHFVKVSHNHALNSMDSKNLAICWWPTLLPLHFSDMVMFEQMRPHLEESIQTMIDQFDVIFEGDDPICPTT